MKENCTGAGIILFFDNRGIVNPTISGLQKDILFLFLMGLDGKFDFPKGTKDFGEMPLDCAIRETYEEINLRKDDYFLLTREGKAFSQRENSDHVLKMYIAEIKKDSLSRLAIKKNMTTLKKEHDYFVLKTKDSCEDGLLRFLKEPLKWGNNVILDYLEA